MNYEQKYKEALGWMQSLYDGLHGPTKEEAEHYFPELKESEDERIKKEIIDALRSREEKTPTEWLEWLENQGTKENKKRKKKFKVGDWIVRKDTCEAFCVSEIFPSMYVITDIDGENYHVATKVVDTEYTPWSIAFAKEGDVLVDTDTNTIGVFHELYGLTWHSKFYYSSQTELIYATKIGGAHKQELAVPATKLQREQLCKKVQQFANAGDEWGSQQ